MPNRKKVVISLLGVSLDRGTGSERWATWRPSVALCQQDDFVVDRLELLYPPRFASLAETISNDIQSVSPETKVNRVSFGIGDPWDFEEVYSALLDFIRNYRFDLEHEEYYAHITTGTHVAQICLFLLTESRHLPGKLIQTSPQDRNSHSFSGTYTIIDLDLSRYDRIASRFQTEKEEASSFLKSGIETRSPKFNQLVDEIEHVAMHSKEPILLMGPTGAGKSQLARRIFELKKARNQVTGDFVEVNCATLRGDTAMSTLFGHIKGSFTGAMRDRDGLLRSADRGILFLDEIGELGLDEQAILLRAIEEKRFPPVGSDREVTSNFQLIAGTNCDLGEMVRKMRFREDLLARINLWTFKLPSLKDRKEDIEPNLDYELEQFALKTGKRVTMSKEVREAFLHFAESPTATWKANFRDLNAAITRMATLSPTGRISLQVLEAEMKRLKSGWTTNSTMPEKSLLDQILDADKLSQMDLFDQLQLMAVINICQTSTTLSEAGRKLFSVTREKKKNANDADRLRKYLARFQLTWADIHNRQQN